MKNNTSNTGTNKEGATTIPSPVTENENMKGEAASTAPPRNDQPAGEHGSNVPEEFNTSEPDVEHDVHPHPDSAAGGSAATEKPDAQPETAEEVMAKHMGEVPKAENKFSLAALKSKGEQVVPRSNTRPGTVTAEKPKDDTFVRTSTNPEEWAAFDFVQLKSEEKFYLITPDILEEIGELNESHAKIVIRTIKRRLIYSVTRHGEIFLWPITIMDGLGWLDSALTCAEEAKEKWIRVVSNLNAKRYDFMSSPCTDEPKWPSMTYEEAVLKAFDGKIIESMGHEVIRQLLGEG